MPGPTHNNHTAAREKVMPQNGVKIDLIDYDSDQVSEKKITNVEDCFAFKDTPTVTWINVEGLRRVDLIETIGTHFELHPLLIEDILTTAQRPKIEDYKETLLIVFKMLSYDSKLDKLRTEHVSLILHKHYVISFQEGARGDLFDPVRQNIREKKGKIREKGTDFLVYSILDAIVDNYFSILERVGERLERIESDVVKNPKPMILHTVQRLRRRMAELRRSIWPLREVTSSLAKGDSPLVAERTRIYFRDVYEHIIQVIETMETNRDVIAGLVDVYLSSVSNRMNEIMKVLTVITTLFIPLTFITGLYGMNFAYMPGLNARWGYPVVLVLMFGVFSGMLVYFRNRKWF